MLQSSHTATQLTVSLSSCSRQETHKIRSSPKFSMRTAFSFLHTFSVSVLLNTTRSGRWNRRGLFCTASLLRNSSATSPHLRFYPRRLVYCSTLRSSSPSASTFFEQLVYEPEESLKHEEDLSSSTEREIFNFDSSFESIELKRFDSPVVDVKELEELPEQWRRSRLAWLCKELPAHKHNTLIRILNAQRKWLRQEDATYIVCHCMRIRENEAAFRVYKWMMLQHWFQFDFALATRLADYLGKERKYLKCREVYDDILNQGRVPAESTFHILVVAYLSSSGQSVVEEAFSIYSRMIQLGGYRPRLSLHNSLFKALVGKQGGSFEETLKRAEFIYHNLTTSGLQIHKDIYGGLIWLHSYQDLIDKDRIALLRTEMRLRGIEESTDVLVSVLRACSKDGDVEEAERTWSKLLSSNPSPPPQAFMFRMVTYAKIGEHMKSLEIFRRMQEELGSTAVIAYHKIIEVLSKAEKLELAESIMTEFIDSGLGPLRPSFIHMMEMYSTLGLHEKLESTFFQCLKKCRPNRKVFSIYLDSLVQIDSINKAGEVFNQMIENTSIGVNAHCCNSILRGYLSQGEHIKAEKVYGLMRLKKYDIDSSLIEKLSFVLSLRQQKDVKEPIRQKLSIEQREVMVGLLLGGLQIKSDAERKKHLVHFEFSENLKHHSVLRRHIYDKYREWLACPDKLADDDDDDDVPWVFTTIPHSYFGFYADQFWQKGQPTIPKLIHRWLSPRVLAYWYMYSGYRTSSGDILLRLKGSQEGIENIVKTLKAKSLDCRLKRKGSSFWLGFLGDKSTWFWKLVEPFILDDLKDCLRPGGILSDDLEGIQTIDSGSESDEKPSECSDGEM